MQTLIAKIKNAWRSRTIWFNVIMASLPTLLDQASGTLPQLQSYLPANVYETMAVALIVGNFLLRFVTTLPLEAK